MGYVTKECNHKGTKIYKILLGVIGGLICVTTVGVGVATSFSLPIVGLVLMVGVLPLEIVSTCMLVKGAKVENVTEEIYEEFYENNGQLLKRERTSLSNQILLKAHDKVAARKIDGRFIYFDDEVKKNFEQGRPGVIGPVRFTNITPIQHYEGEDIRINSRKRVIEFKPKGE